jgi:hypothetical protein
MVRFLNGERKGLELNPVLCVGSNFGPIPMCMGVVLVYVLNSEWHHLSVQLLK